MAKNSHFVPIDLPDPPVEKQTADPTEEDWPSPEQFLPVLNKISDELSKIQQGTSAFTPHGINFSTGMNSGSSPLFTVFGRFKEKPTRDHMEKFLDMAEQDINLAARRGFTKWLKVVTKKEDSNG